jgi:hypothetical protein
MSEPVQLTLDDALAEDEDWHKWFIALPLDPSGDEQDDEA